MGWFEHVPIWEETTKEEYDKWYHSDDCLLDYLTNNINYRKEPIYEKQGLLAMMDPNNKIIDYKYYKKVKDKLYYLCGNVEYEYWKDKFDNLNKVNL